MKFRYIIYELKKFYNSDHNFIFWGNSKLNAYGPGVRTRRLESYIKNKKISKKLIYMQSHWPWYELIICIIYSLIIRTPIVFNQNGVYKKSYKKTYWINNMIILIALLNSKVIIYQSNFCKNSIKKISSKILWRLINFKKNLVIINPCPNIIYKNTKDIRSHTLIISNSFSKDRKYYAKYIFNLVQVLKEKNYIKKINIVGPITSRLNISEIEDLTDSNKIKLHGFKEQIELKAILSESTIGIHLNYADPSPNMVCEYMSHRIPVLVNKEGGSKEIARKACIFTENNLIFDDNYMPDIESVEICLKNLIKEYKLFAEYAENRAKKLSIKNYSYQHLNIFSSL